MDTPDVRFRSLGLASACRSLILAVLQEASRKPPGSLQEAVRSGAADMDRKPEESPLQARAASCRPKGAWVQERPRGMFQWSFGPRAAQEACYVRVVWLWGIARSSRAVVSVSALNVVPDPLRSLSYPAFAGRAHFSAPRHRTQGDPSL